MIRIVLLLTISVVACIYLQQLLLAEDKTVEQGVPNELAAASEDMHRQIHALKKRLDETKGVLANKEEFEYVLVMGPLLSKVASSPVSSSQAGRELLIEFANTVFSADIGKPPNVKAYEVQLDLGRDVFTRTPLDVKLLSDGNTESIVSLLQLWKYTLEMEEYYAEFNTRNPSDEWKQKLDTSRVFASYKGPFGASNMSPEHINDPKVRTKYEQYLKDRHEFHAGSVKFIEIARIGKRFRMHAARYLGEQFGDGPMDEKFASLVRKHQPQLFKDVQKGIHDQIKLLKELDAWQPPLR